MRVPPWHAVTEQTLLQQAWAGRRLSDSSRIPGCGSRAMRRGEISRHSLAVLFIVGTRSGLGLGFLSLLLLLVVWFWCKGKSRVQTSVFSHDLRPLSAVVRAGMG